MKKFAGKFAASLAAMAFGVAGLAALLAGATITTTLFRATLAAILFLVIGRLIAVILDDGPMELPEAPRPDTKKEEGS